MSPSPDSKVFTYAQFDLEALCLRASTLRRGVPCACDSDQRPSSGSFNWVIFILFEDGVRWVFRSIHSRSIMPEKLGLKLLESEIATLLYLRAHSDIPVPEVYHYCTSSDNEIGIPFLLMSEASGQPLSAAWNSTNAPQPALDNVGKAKVLSQLGAITQKLAQLRFDKIGSLFPGEESVEIKECLSRGHLLHGRHALDIPRGPFNSQAEFYDSLVSAFCEHAEILQLSHHCFLAPVPSRKDYDSSMDFESAVNLWNDFVTIGGKIDSSDNRLDYRIIGDSLRHIIPRLNLPAAIPGSFPLYHADLSVNNIFVDDDFNITCIIDWAFASTVPESILLATPGLPQYSDELGPELHIPFIEGFMTPTTYVEEEMGNRYRELLQRGQVSWRLIRLLNFDSTSDYNLFATLWDFVGHSIDGLGQFIQQQRGLPDYTRLYEELNEEDQPILKVKREEKEYFRNNDVRMTIARHLTVISGWKAQCTVNQPRKLRHDMFMASPRLWKWIIQVIQDREKMS